MNKKGQKILDILLIIFIMGLSVIIFLLRDRIHNVSNVSYIGLFLLCFLANSTVLLPSPSLMIVASCALIMNPIFVVMFAALGSTFGELVGYAFGTATKELSPKFQKVLDKTASRINNESLLVFTFAVLPIPLFDIVGIYSGGAKMNLFKFFIFCYLGKFIKMLVYTRMYDILELISAYAIKIGV